MSVWYAIPTAMPTVEAERTLQLWRNMGYRLALYCDVPRKDLKCDLQLYGDYRGYPKAVNRLCREILNQYPDTNVIVTGGDDIDPDPRHSPELIETEFLTHFRGTFGVMQPTGDRWMVNSQGLCAAERVCESPWMGREFIQKAYQGTGPYCEEYYHFFADEELHDVAIKLGILWNRSDLVHHHHHWSREGRPRPSYLAPAKLNWDQARELFRARQLQGFPGHV